MFNDIFGAPKYSGQVLPKIPYGTKAVKVFQDILFICDIVKEGMLPDENFLSNNISVIVITNMLQKNVLLILFTVTAKNKLPAFRICLTFINSIFI